MPTEWQPVFHSIWLKEVDRPWFRGDQGDKGFLGSISKNRMGEAGSTTIRIVVGPASGEINPNPASAHGKGGFDPGPRVVTLRRRYRRVGRLVQVNATGEPPPPKPYNVMRRKLFGFSGSVSARYSLAFD